MKEIEKYKKYIGKNKDKMQIDDLNSIIIEKSKLSLNILELFNKTWLSVNSDC